MFDENKFRAQLMLKGITLADIAKALDINLVTLYRKMNGDSDFYRNEVQIICEFIELEDPVSIFFAEKIT